MQRRLLTFIAAASVLALATASRADDQILNLIPDDAFGFVVVNNIGTLNGKVDKLVKQMNIAVPVKPLDMLKQETGIGEGLNQNGAAGVMFLPHAHGEPDVILGVLPVSDYKKFLASLQPGETDGPITKIKLRREHWVAQKGNYAIFGPTERSDKTKAAIKHVLESSKSIAPIVAPFKTWMGSSEVAGAITPNGLEFVVAEGGRRAEQAKSKVDPNNPRADQSKQALDGFIAMLPEATKEFSQAGFGLKLDEQAGPRLEIHAQLKSTGQLSSIAKTLRSTQPDGLNDLPGGPFVVALSGHGSPDGMEGFMRHLSELKMRSPAWSKLSDAEKQKMIAIGSQVGKAMRGMSLELLPPAKGKSALSGLVGVIQVDDATKFLGDYEKALKEASAILKDKKIPGEVTAVESASVGEFKALDATISMEGAPASADPFAQMIIPVLVGREPSFHVYLAALDNKNVGFACVDKENITKIAASLKEKKGLGADAELAKTKSLLPSDAAAMSYLSVNGLLDSVRTLSAQTFFPIMLPDFPAAPPIGKATKLTESELEVTLVIPNGLVDAIGKYIDGLTAGPRPGGPPPGAPAPTGTFRPQ